MHQFRPCGRIWRQSPDQIANRLRISGPVDATIVFKYFWRLFDSMWMINQLFLINGLDVTFGQCINSFKHQIRTNFHHPVMQIAHRIVFTNVYLFLKNDSSGINFVRKQKCGDTCFSFAIYDCPVEWGSSAILRKQRGMQVESAHWRHIPDYFRQHPESHNNLKISFQAFQFSNKFSIFQPFGLKHPQSVFNSELFYRRFC